MLARPDPQETDDGPHRDKGAVERLCVATRTVKPISELIRFVVAPDGAVVPDLKRKLPGRGVWVTGTRAAVGEAVKRNAFARSFKSKVKAAPDLPDTVERLLSDACLDALAMVHKAGRVAIGFAKTDAALAHEGGVAALIHASDASADGVRKLAAAAKRRFDGDEDRIPAIQAFTSAQLDLALGRSNVIHAALLAGPASNGFLTRCSSLQRFRAIDPDGRGGAVHG